MIADRNGWQDNGPPPLGEVPVDLCRAFVFPNRVRDVRRDMGYAKLLRLSAELPDIPYIRLSKIERGEVFPRIDELQRIAAALRAPAADLLVDVDAPDFDCAEWAEPFRDGEKADAEEEAFAVLLGAAIRAHRTADGLTIAAIERDFGLAPVNLSRLENAQKTFGRWNGGVRGSVLALFGAQSETELRALVLGRHRSGALDAALAAVPGPQERHERTRARIAELAAALRGAADVPPRETAAEAHPLPAATPGGKLAVRGVPLPGGLIGDQATGEQVDVPTGAGVQALALKVCRATLGAGLPSQAVVIIDPERYPAPGGLAAIRESEGWRLLSVGSSRDGRMIGYSCNPELEIVLDDRDPAELATVIAAIFP